MYECRRNIKEFSMKMIQFLKKELKEEISDNPWTFNVLMFMIVPTFFVSIACFFDDPWAFCVIMFMIAFIVLLTIVCYFDSMEQERQERHEQTIREYYDSGKVFATDKITVTDKYFAKTSNGKGVQKRVTVKFDGRSYYISDSKLYDKAKKGDRLKGYYVYDYIWGNYCKVLYLAEGKHVRMQEEYQ